VTSGVAPVQAFLRFRRRCEEESPLAAIWPFPQSLREEERTKDVSYSTEETKGVVEARDERRGERRADGGVNLETLVEFWGKSGFSSRPTAPEDLRHSREETRTPQVEESP